MKKLLFLVIFINIFFYTNEVRATIWVKPVDGTISNPFGNNYKFYNMYRAGHTGIDIKVPIGTPVHAVSDGIVKYIKSKPNMRYGYYIVLEHENNIYSLYAHLQKINVKLNSKVIQGQIIGNTGISGLASYPHLHFEITNEIPVRDGAWGYNYICKTRSDKEIDTEKIKMKSLNKIPLFDFLPLTTIQEKFSFINSDKKYIEHLYRMKNKICIEENIKPITYYNPENFLPKYEKSDMPEFKRLFIRKRKKLSQYALTKHSQTFKIKSNISSSKTKLPINNTKKT